MEKSLNEIFHSRVGVNLLVILLLSVFNACTDYVQQIDNQYVEWMSTCCLIDSRDGQMYKIVSIGNRTWMAQNLNYEMSDSYCYNDSAEYCDKYGRLYSWTATKMACPSGWHMPTKDDFETLFATVGGQSIAGKMLKSTSGWSEGGYGSDSYSFTALAAGLRDANGNFIYEGNYAYFWSSDEFNKDVAYYVDLYYVSDLSYLDRQGKLNALSVRCIKD